MNGAAREPVGVILAGGRGRRLGGSKATVELGGRPLIMWPLAAMRAAVADVAVVAKPDTQLPDLDGVAVWREPGQPSHPLVGIVHALARSGGRSVLVCAADLPFVTPAALRRLAGAEAGDAPAVIAAHDGAAHPLLGRYEPACARLLVAAADEGSLPMRRVLSAIGARELECDEHTLFNINTPQDLERAQAHLAGRQPNVKS
ncbi:MAG TPA: molybdenum cofactor guanylyltransferase [Solirubrobacteraceae bacterium]|jgi:molybdopterin-guanine dinucleotide biosynthesis protein A